MKVIRGPYKGELGYIDERRAPVDFNDKGEIWVSFYNKVSNPKYPKQGKTYVAGHVKPKDLVYADPEREKKDPAKNLQKFWQKPEPERPQAPIVHKSSAEGLWDLITSTGEDAEGPHADDWRSLLKDYKKAVISADGKGLFKNDLRVLRWVVDYTFDDHAVDLVCQKWEAEGGICVDDNPNAASQSILTRSFDSTANLLDHPEVREQLGIKNDEELKRFALSTGGAELEDVINHAGTEWARKLPEVQKILKEEAEKEAKKPKPVPKPQATPGTAEELLRNPLKKGQ